jgi:hypothetical protein
MKARLTIWSVLVIAAVVVAIAVWNHRAAKLPTTVQAAKGPAAVIKLVGTPISKQTPSVGAEKLETASPSLAQIVADDKAEYRNRLDAIETLAGNKLEDSDREILYHFLRSGSPADNEQAGQVLKNQLLDALCQMQPPPVGLGELLGEIFHDQSQNIVMRDYAIQHLVAYYRQVGESTGINSQEQADDLKQARQTLWDALNNTDSSIAGTALLGLTRLSQEGWTGFDQNQIGQAALNLVGSSGAGELTKITAMQVCANLNVKEALPVALSTARQANTESERISAIAAIGALGGAGQEAFLTQLAQGNDERLKLPAQQALGQIEKRLQPAIKAKSS